MSVYTKSYKKHIFGHPDTLTVSDSQDNTYSVSLTKHPPGISRPVSLQHILQRG